MRALVRAVTLVLLTGGPVLALDVSVTDSPYNAVPDDGYDDSAAFASALGDIVTAGGGTLVVPCGDYHFTSQTVVDLGATAVTMRGDGTGVSNIHCANTTGLFWFDNTSNGNQLTITGMTFTADEEGGTALRADNPSLTSATICNLYMEHVNYRVLTDDVDYFTHSILGSNLQQPQFVNVYVDNGMKDYSVDGFRIDNCNSPFFDQCYSKAVGTGVHLTNSKGSVVLQRMYVVGNYVGCQIDADADDDCSVTITDCHSNDYTEGIHIVNADHVSLLEGMSYRQEIEDYTDYILENCSDVTVKSCNFHQSETATSVGRTMVYLKGTTSGVILRSLIFNGAGTRVLQDSGVGGVSISACLDIPVLDL
jgi:hypothetical protein